MGIIKTAVKRPVTVLMCVLVVIVIGYTSFSKIPLDLMPKMNIPIALVQTSYEGAGPYEVENLVTRPLESVLSTVENVKNIYSDSSEGSSIVIIEFSDDTDMDFATLQMREKIDMIKSALPDDTTAPMVFKLDPNMMPIAMISVTKSETSKSEINDIALKSYSDNTVSPALERIAGVAGVSTLGGRTREIRVNLRQDKLTGYGISANTVVSLLRAENLNLPGGSVSYGDKSLIVRTVGEFNNISDIKSVPIPLPTGATIYLSDIADIGESFKKTSSISRLNGGDAVTISLQKATDANTVNVVEAVSKEIDKLNKNNPEYSLGLVFDQAEYIKLSINNLTQSALLGGILAILVLFLFLHSFKMSMIIGTAIPISIIATFNAMYFSNMSLNIISLGGLALGIGMLVDNAIVVLDNIHRMRSEGKDAIEASLIGTKEVFGPILASTLTTIVVFLPIVFVEGFASQIFANLSLTVTFSLLSSLVVAATVVPSICARFDAGRPYKARSAFMSGIVKIWDGAFNAIDSAYRRLLKGVIRHRFITILCAIIIFVSSCFLLPSIGTELMPVSDQGQINISVKLPGSTKIEETNKTAAEIESILTGFEDVEKITTSIGSGSYSALTGGSADSASITLNLVEKEKRLRSTVETVELIRQKLAQVPGTEISVTASSSYMGGMSVTGSGGVTIIVYGDEIPVLKEISETYKNALTDIESLREVKTTFESGKPEFTVYVDRQKAAAFGLAGAQVAQYLRIAMAGTVATTLRVDGEAIDVTVALPESENFSISQLNSLSIQTPTGAFIPLSSIVKTDMASGNIVISRENQKRYVTVTASIYGTDLGSATEEIRAKLEAIPLPSGYRFSLGGDYETMMESFGSLGLALLLAILLVYMVMAAQFESLLYPIIIMFTLPLAFTGSIAALYISGQTLNVSSIIGAIMLTGIVVNNAIVLIDYINQKRKEGLSCEEAIIFAGPRRLRPILMTSLTTILGLLPLALATGEGTEMQLPMSVLVIGGLISSTFLTLVIIPAIYMSITSRKEKRKLKKEARKSKKLNELTGVS